MGHGRMEPLPAPGLYTVAEAAYVTEMDTKAIDREIDAHIVQPAGQPGRLLEKPSLFYLAAIRDIRTAIDAKSRASLAQRVLQAVAQREGTVTFGCFLLPLAQLTRALKPRLEVIDALRGAFEVNPNVAAGEPVVRGTRLKAHMLAEMVRRGVPASEVATEYELTEDKVRLAALYDTLYPRRGRPPAQRHDVRKSENFSI